MPYARVYTVVAISLGVFSVVLWFLVGPLPRDSLFRTPVGNRDHAVRVLPYASMLQAADSCEPGHFGPDETYGYWVQDFQFVLGAPRPDSVFAVLASRPEPMAQVYGLIGLQLTDSSGFERAWSAIPPRDTAIWVSDSCAEPERRSLSTVLADIKHGKWGQRLVRRRVDVH